jgi:serine/threonine-protein kinase
MRPAQSPVQPGEILAGKYRVDRVIGVGGMGVVVQATHLDLAEARAIKFMLPTALSDAELVDRFLREARAASRLKNEHVAHVYDVGRLDNGAPYMVMEYLEGTDLSARLKREGPLHFQEVVFYVLQACEALAEAHASGIVHRDLKPANLFLANQLDTTPLLKVLDFGISKVIGPTGHDSDLTRTDVVLGSPHYMSPEQMSSSRSVDARADIWSLGVILYQLVTGKLPFRGAGITEIVAQVLQGELVLPSQLQPGVPAELDAVIVRCLQRDLERRYATVVELAQALAPFVPTVAPYYLERIQRIAAATPAGILRATGNALPLVPAPGQPLTPRPIQLTPRAGMAPSASGTGTFGATTSPTAPGRARALPIAAVAIVALLAGGVITYFAVPRGPAVGAASAARDTANTATTAPPLVTATATATAAPASASASASASAPPLASASASASASARPAARTGTLDPFGSSRK